MLMDQKSEHSYIANQVQAARNCLKSPEQQMWHSWSRWSSCCVVANAIWPPRKGGQPLFVPPENCHSLLLHLRPANWLCFNRALRGLTLTKTSLPSQPRINRSWTVHVHRIAVSPLLQQVMLTKRGPLMVADGAAHWFLCKLFWESFFGWQCCH